MESSVNRFLKFVEETQNIPYFSTLYDIDMWEEDKKKIVKDLEVLEHLKKLFDGYKILEKLGIKHNDIYFLCKNGDDNLLKEWLEK